METNKPERNWKLKLRFGKIKTPYKHFTVIAEGTAREEMKDFSCPPGKAFMAMKTWSSSPDESGHMAQVIGEQIGFDVTGKVEIYETEPTQPPSEHPRGYDIQFTPFSNNDE
jgi:hypothetical protein